MLIKPQNSPGNHIVYDLIFLVIILSMVIYLNGPHQDYLEENILIHEFFILFLFYFIFA
jgi:hypothetical protein